MEVVPKKRFGQHFLRDSAVLNRILHILEPSVTDVFLEVGAGMGALTTRIAQHGASVYAVEVDADIVPVLAQATASYPSVTIVPEDILSVDISSLLCDALPGRVVRAVGNLPYNIATPVIEKCLGCDIPFKDLTFMTQLEVAQRIVASPGSKTYGYLSVMCQHRADVRIALKVSPGSFSPPPKVISAVVGFQPRGKRFDAREERCFSAVARAAFGHRRKMLSNSLRRDRAVGPRADTLLERARIDGSRRPEQLTVQEYEQLGLLLSELF